MEKFTHITTSVPTTISINGQNTYTLSTPQLKWVDVLHKKDIFVSFLPNDSCYLPTTINTRLNNTDNVEIIPYINNHQEIIYTPSKIICDKIDVVLYEKTIDNLYIKILSNERNYVNISHPTKGELLNKVIPSLLTITDEINNYVYIKGITKENKYYIILIHNQDIVLEGVFDIIEESSKNIKFLTLIKDISKHGIVYVFDKKSCDIDNYPIYENNKPYITTNNRLVPYAFMECVKVKDFTLSKHYLKESFVSNEHITSFFGNIKNIYFNTYVDDKINYTILTNDIYKSFNFEVNSGKIMEIEEVGF